LACKQHTALRGALNMHYGSSRLRFSYNSKRTRRWCKEQCVDSRHFVQTRWMLERLTPMPSVNDQNNWKLFRARQFTAAFWLSYKSQLSCRILKQQVKSSRMSWYGHTALLERRVLPQNVLVERRKRKGYLGGQSLSRRIILKWILEKLVWSNGLNCLRIGFNHYNCELFVNSCKVLTQLSLPRITDDDYDDDDDDFIRLYVTENKHPLLYQDRWVMSSEIKHFVKKQAVFL
jgi:hypothetical protein